MTLDVGTALAIGLPALGIAATWGAFSYRLRQLEKDAAAIPALLTSVAQVDDKVEFVRKDQGGRLGKLEADTAVLKGQFEGFQSGFGAGRRSRTAAQGNPVPGGGDRNL